MERDRPRWRIRISTLMLLVIIAALASALVVERWKRTVEEQRALAVAERALAEALRAEAQAVAQARKAGDEAKGSVPAPPRETSGRATQAASERTESGP
jgi:type II secretory pathway pseudopilin PulG